MHLGSQAALDILRREHGLSSGDPRWRAFVLSVGWWEGMCAACRYLGLHALDEVVALAKILRQVLGVSMLAVGKGTEAKAWNMENNGPFSTERHGTAKVAGTSGPRGQPRDLSLVGASTNGTRHGLIGLCSIPRRTDWPGSLSEPKPVRDSLSTSLSTSMTQRGWWAFAV